MTTLLGWIDDGESPIQILVSCGIFLEGTDLPMASSIIFARPTKSLMLWLQAIGRGVRSYSGKDNLILLDHSGATYEHGPIDIDQDWKLDYLKGDVVKRGEKRKERIRKTITCGKCKALYEKRLDCPDCGWKPEVAGKPVATYAAYLQALDEIEHPKVDEKSWYLQLKGYCLEYGKKEGWIYYKFIEKFSHKPPWAWKSLDPIPPGIEVRSWIRSKNIAWAKSQEKTRNGATPWKREQWGFGTVASHGRARMDKMAGDAYMPEGE